MKKLIIMLSALITGAAAVNAAVEVALGSGTDGTETIFTYSNLVATATFDGGVLDDATTVISSTPFSGASGSFTVTWTGIARTVNPATWSFETNGIIDAGSSGWGVSSPGDGGGANQLGFDEALLLTFNTNNLVLDTGKFLVFSIISGDNESFRIYQRTGPSSSVVADAVSSFLPAVPSAFVTVDGLLQFAITDSGWDAGVLNRMMGITIDVIEEITTVNVPSGVNAVAADSTVLLGWDPDITGFLDYYTVYRSTVSGTNNYEILETNVVGTTYTDSIATNGTTFYYSVTATDTNGLESGFSDEVSVTPQPASTDVSLLLHYDASNVASVLADSNNVVTVWSNLVSDAYHAVPSLGDVYYPSTGLSKSGLAGLDFTTNRTRLSAMTTEESQLLLNLTGEKSGLVVLVALRGDLPASQDDFFGNTSTVSEGFGLRRNSDGDYQTWLAGETVTVNTPAGDGDTVVISYKYDVPTREITVWESAGLNTDTGTRVPGNFSLNDPLTIGNTQGASRYLKGEIFEIKVWNSTLPDATLETERNAMVSKWVGAGFNAWASQWGVDIGFETNDYDDDGIFNIYEYGLAGNPTNTTVEPAVLPVLINTGSGLEYVYIQRNNDESLTYTVETTTDLVSVPWTSTGVTAVSTNLNYAASFHEVTNTVSSGDDTKFIRLIIEN